MRIANRGLLLLTLFFHAQIGHPQTISYDPTQRYSKESLKTDLRFVHDNLEKMHPGLYRYLTRPSLDRFFDSVDHVITGPMTAQEFYRLLTLLHSRIRNGHTMFLPGDSAMAYFNHSGRLLPLGVYFENGKLTIVENYSADSTLQAGSEILSINGLSVSSIMAQLLARQVRDGYNRTYPIWILNHYFSAYYSFIFGQPAEFSLELKAGTGEQKTSTGERYTKHVTSLTKDSIHYYRQTRYAAQHPPDKEGQGIVLQEEKEKNVAVLTIKSFDPDLLQSLYHQEYPQVFDSLFTQISHHQINTLILDLRDNQGGEFSPGRALLSFLVLHPSRFLLDGKEAGIIQPRVNHFKGRLFVLMNGGSFSSTAIVCACLKRDRRALFIGEETGGNPHVISGDPAELVLPQTKIKAEISTITYRITTGPNDGHGLMPDYPVHPTIAGIVAGKDPAKALAVKLAAALYVIPKPKFK